MQSFYLPPHCLELVTVSGPDASKFLQGQLTCDVEALTNGAHVRGAACNNKGRVHAIFLLVRHDDVFHLVFTSGLGQIFITALKKYLPFYKCTLQLAPPAWHCAGAAGPLAAATIGTDSADSAPTWVDKVSGDGWLCTSGREQFLLCGRTDVPDGPVTQLSARLQSALPQGDLNAWHRYGLDSGYFPFTPEDAEKFTPQELQLEQHDYISFSKGCYTGQEIVARMHYRGKPKKQLYLLRTDKSSADMLAKGFDISDGSGKVIAHTLKQFQDESGGLLALAWLPIDLADVSGVVAGDKLSILSLRAF
jgi:hypothetical protein